VIGTGWVDSVLVGDDLPEFGTDLVTALTTLHVNNFSHNSNEYKLPIFGFRLMLAPIKLFTQLQHTQNPTKNIYTLKMTAYLSLSFY
jgi:hypothetical protein